MEVRTNVKFKLVSIENEIMNKDFGKDILENIDEQVLKFQYKMATVIKMSEDIIIVIPSFRYLYNDKVVFEASAEFIYSIRTLAAALDIDRDNRKINVKSDIFPSLLGTSYSTLRGMAFERMLQTPLAKYPAPVIEVDTLLNRNGISVED